MEFRELDVGGVGQQATWELYVVLRRFETKPFPPRTRDLDVLLLLIQTVSPEW